MGAIVQYYNLTGGLNTIAGIGTINQTPKKTESPDMQNVEFYKLGGLQSMEGNTQFSKTLLTAPVALGHEYIYEDRKYLLVVTTDGEVWEYDRVLDEFVSLNTKYNLNEESTAGRKIFEIGTARYSAVNFNNGVVLTNGVEDLIYYKKNRHILLSGEVSGIEGSNQITGNLTTFKTELHKGDFIAFGYDSEEYYIVEEVVSDTEAILSVPLKTTITDSTAYLGPFSYCNAMMIDSTNVENEDEVKDLIGTPIRGLALQAYQGRLWVGGTDGILYYSEVGLYNGWDIKFGAGNFPEFYNDTSAFTALALWDKVLVVCKRERTYLLDGTAPDDTAWKIEPYSVNTVESQQSWIDCNNGLWGFSKRENGIYPILQRTIYNAFFGGNDLSLKISDIFDYINQAKYDEIFPVYHAKKGYIMFYIPLLTGLGSNDCFCWDTRSKSWLHRKVPQEVTTAFEFNNEVYIGTKDGKVLKEFFGLTFDGEPIEFWWKSPWFYFGDTTNNKTTKEFRIKISEEATNKFKIRNRRDGRDVFKSRNVTNNLDAFIGLVWDVDYQEGDLNPEYSLMRKVIKVTDTFNEYYTPYTTAVELAETVPLNTALFSDELCKNLETFVGLPYRWEVTNNLDEADRYEPDIKTIYRFTYTLPQWKRYFDGYTYLWIPFNSGKPTVDSICKISKHKTDEQIGYVYTRVGSWLTPDGKFDASKGPTNIAGPNGYVYIDDKGVPSPIEYIARASNPKDVRNLTFGETVYKVRDANGRFYDGSPEMGYQTIYVNKKGSYLFNQYSPDNNPVQCWQFFKGEYKTCWETSSFDYFGTTGEETGIDITLAGDAIIKKVTEDNGRYTIETTAGTFTEMVEDGTEDDAGYYCYSYSEDGTNGEPLFEDTRMTLKLGEWNNTVSGYNATIDDYSINLTNPESMEAQVFTMYKKEPLLFAKVGEPFEVYDYWRYRIQPNYSGETITDTVWANGFLDDPSSGRYEPDNPLYEKNTLGDSWVISRQITKRFPLPDQYFETMQIEFYGNAIDEGMAIYGFEIDGVELEEVPVR